jgi:hypothetical protein
VKRVLIALVTRASYWNRVNRLYLLEGLDENECFSTFQRGMYGRCLVATYGFVVLFPRPRISFIKIGPSNLPRSFGMGGMVSRGPLV